MCYFLYLSKNWCFWTWCWRRLLRVLWTAKRSKQSILKEISPGCSLEGLMLKLKLQYFDHLMRRVDSLEKTLMLGGIGGRRRRGRQKMRWLDGFTDLLDMSLGGLRELVMDREAWHTSVHRVTNSRTRLSDWTELNWIFHCVYLPQLPYPFVCQWTSRLLPCPGYYKQCCEEHWGTRVPFTGFLVHWYTGFLSVCAQQWDCWVIWQFYFQFFKESPHCSP